MKTTGRLGARHFTLAKHTAFILGHGSTCLIVPTLACPCLTIEQQFDPLCSQCKGTGLWLQENLQYETTLLLTAEHSRKGYHEPGSWVEGTIMATTLPGVRLEDRDLVRVLDIADEFADEVLQRNIHDAVRFSAGVELLQVADVDRTYTPGVDYVLTAPNIVTWLPGGQAPANGEYYSVRYRALPEYLVFLDSPRLRIEHRIPQSQTVMLRRLDKITRD